MTLVHGGNVYEVAEDLGISPEEVLDLSASINPLGPPEGLRELFREYFSRIRHYPDIHNRALMAALAKFHGIAEDHFVVGNGSTELIYLLPKALGISKALITLPTFGEYQKAFELSGIKLTKLITSDEENFQPTMERLQATYESVRPEAVLVTHPGSPAGTLLDPEVAAWLLEQSRTDGIYAVVDEVFIDYCEPASLKSALKNSQKIVLIRSMTKFYGIPGLRLGYLITSPSIAKALRNLLPPWSVNTFAQIAGIYCLAQKDFQEKSLGVVREEREFLISRLKEVPLCRVFPSSANFLLVKLDESLPPVSELRRHLLSSEHILVRDCSSFDGLDHRYLRFAIHSPKENRRFLEAFLDWIERSMAR